MGNSQPWLDVMTELFKAADNTAHPAPKLTSTVCLMASIFACLIMGQTIAKCCGFTYENEETEPLNPNMVQQQVEERDDDGERSGIRAFLIAQHDKHGYLLLQAVRRRKGAYTTSYRGVICGQGELRIHGLDQACLQTAAREFYEETGIDLRNSLHRLELCRFPDGSDTFKNRRYFRVSLTDADMVPFNTNHKGKHARALTGENFTLHLSYEHTGFIFEKDLIQASEAVIHHSGGKNAYALREIEGARLAANGQGPQAGGSGACEHLDSSPSL